MRLHWTRPALADLVEAQAFIAQDDPQSAHKVAQHIWDAATNLRDNPDIGRPGHVSGTREWVVTRTPYLIVYRTQHDAVEILRVWHTRRDWRNEPTE